jgi:hypothetical protein
MTTQCDRILLVDDEQAVLDGLFRQHRKHYTFVQACGSAAGLQVVAEDGRLDAAAFESSGRARSVQIPRYPRKAGALCSSSSPVCWSTRPLWESCIKRVIPPAASGPLGPAP